MSAGLFCSRQPYIELFYVEQKVKIIINNTLHGILELEALGGGWGGGGGCCGICGIWHLPNQKKKKKSFFFFFFSSKRADLPTKKGQSVRLPDALFV